MKRSRHFLGLLMMAAMVVVSACGSASTRGGSSSPGSSGSPSSPPAKPKELKEVSLRLDWLLGSEHTAYFVAAEKGYFEQAGLKVKILEGEGSSVTVKLVGNGNDTFGVVAAGTVMQSVAQGVPVQAVSTVFQNTPTAVIFPKSKPVQSLQELKGKTLGVLIKSVTYNEWNAVAKLNSFDTKQAKEVAMDRSIVEAMLSGKIDAGIAWLINDGTQLQVKGQETGFIMFKDLGLKVPSSTIVASTDTVKKDPEMVKAFVGAVNKGWQFTIDNQQEAFEIFKKNAPKADMESNAKKLPLVLDLVKTDRGIGSFDTASWDSLRKLYKDFELLKEDVDLAKVYTATFVSK